ncbi:Sal-like protein 1 [Taenia crassiceps]|uniref:Sal-like protein 1 n=1 Tax=Taenia crassiceps TaxID=6207 RepID=A0ABR4QC34_9CEST
MDERARNEKIEGFKRFSEEERPNSTPPVMSSNREDSPISYAMATLESVRSNPTPSQVDETDEIQSTMVTPSENSETIPENDFDNQPSTSKTRAKPKPGLKKNLYCEFCKKGFGLLNILKEHESSQHFNDSAQTSLPDNYSDLPRMMAPFFAMCLGRNSNLPPQLGESESPAPSTIHDTPTTSQHPDVKQHSPNLAPLDLHLGNFPHFPLPQRPPNDPSPMFTPNLDLSGPSRLTPQISPLLHSPLINGMPLLNNTSTLASSGFSTANLLNSNKPEAPNFENIMQLFASMNNGEGLHSLPVPPSTPTLPYDPNYLNAIIKVNEQKNSTSSRPAADNTGTSVITPTETLSNNSACTSPKSGNSESTSTLHQQPAPLPSTSSGAQPSVDTSISHDGKHCRVCNKRFNCGSALKIHFRKHSGERPYVCIHCNKAFTQNGTLKRHYATCKVAKRQAQFGNARIPQPLLSPTPSKSLSSSLPVVPHLPRLPPPINGTNTLMTQPLVPPQNLLEQIFPRQSEQLPNSNLFEGAFRILFENFLAQNNSFNDQLMQPGTGQEIEKGTAMDVCDNAEEPEDLSSSRNEDQGNAEGGFQCENPCGCSWSRKYGTTQHFKWSKWNTQY